MAALRRREHMKSEVTQMRCRASINRGWSYTGFLPRLKLRRFFCLLRRRIAYLRLYLHTVQNSSRILFLPSLFDLRYRCRIASRYAFFSLCPISDTPFLLGYHNYEATYINLPVSAIARVTFNLRQCVFNLAFF